MVRIGGFTVNGELPTSNGLFLGNWNDAFNSYGTFVTRNAPGREVLQI